MSSLKQKLELHESLEAILKEVWDDKTVQKAFKKDNLAITRPKKPRGDLTELERAIYNIYTPYKNTKVKKGTKVWNTDGWYHKIDQAKVQHRIYMNVEADSVETVWDSLRDIFRCHSGVASAKYASKEAAKARYDTIVIYLETERDVEVLLTYIRGLLYQELLTVDMFEATVPRTTKKVKGLLGVSVADQPLQNGWDATQEADCNQSFGTQLAYLVARAFTTTKVKKGKFDALDPQGVLAPSNTKKIEFDAFKKNAAMEFHLAGINPSEPWGHYFNQKQRTEINRIAASALKTRNKKVVGTGKNKKVVRTGKNNEVRQGETELENKRRGKVKKG